MTLVLDDNAVMRSLDPVRLVDAIERALIDERRQPSVVPERLNLAAEGRFLRVMPAIVPGSDVMGLKTFFGGGGVGVRYVVILMSVATGEVLATMDACHLTAARTAATSAVAARAMGVKAARLGILGSGLEAEVHARTFAALGGVELIKVFSPNGDNRARFATRLADELGVPVIPCDDAAGIFDDVEHVVTATNSGYGGPIACRSEWIPSGLYLTAIGSTHQDLRELDVEILHRAEVLIFDAEPTQIASESGDVRAYLESGGDLGAVARLDDLLQGSVGVPTGSGDLTIFKSVGTALQDLVAADLAMRTAEAAGLGVALPDLAVPKTRR